MTKRTTAQEAAGLFRQMADLTDSEQNAKALRTFAAELDGRPGLSAVEGTEDGNDGSVADPPYARPVSSAGPRRPW